MHGEEHCWRTKAGFSLPVTWLGQDKDNEPLSLFFYSIEITRAANVRLHGNDLLVDWPCTLEFSG